MGLLDTLFGPTLGSSRLDYGVASQTELYKRMVGVRTVGEGMLTYPERLRQNAKKLRDEAAASDKYAVKSRNDADELDREADQFDAMQEALTAEYGPSAPAYGY